MTGCRPSWLWLAWWSLALESLAARASAQAVGGDREGWADSIRAGRDRLIYVINGRKCGV